MDLAEPNESLNETEVADNGEAGAAAIDLMKQLITLAAGVLALSATFLEKVGPLSRGLLFILALSWLSLIVSVFGGLQTLSAIVKSRLKGDDGWSKGAGRNYAVTSKYGFLLGIGLFALFAFILLANLKAKAEAAPNSVTVTSPEC